VTLPRAAQSASLRPSDVVVTGVNAAHIPHQAEPPPPQSPRRRRTSPLWLETPLYASLAEQWAAFGRSVPGQTDDEWTALTRPPHR
jgi:hypothetical protein